MRKYDHIEEIAKSGFDTIVEVEKFNPYHDAKGRFSSADSATSFTYAPGKSKAHDMAIAREKERHEKQLANPTNDPETIAGVKRGPAMTHEEADEGRANPKYLTDRNYQINCQTCVVAYEARRRGYDVEARARNRLSGTQAELAGKPEVAWIDPATGKTVTAMKNPTNIRTSKQATQWLEQNMVEGGRYEFAHGWKGTDGRRGHILTATKKNGAVSLFDPQSGKSYTGDSFTEYMGRVKSTYNNGWELKGRLSLIRVDNMQINADVANVVLKGAGRW